jgi:hypothetical protein
MMDLDQIVNKALSRRNFLAGAGAVAATTAIAGCSSNSSSTAPTTTTTTGSSSFTDADVLNFALNLEYLEAEFYLRAANGQGLAAADVSTPSGYTGAYTQGSVTVGSAAQVAGTTAAQQAIINEIAFEEQQHVRFLRAALGSAAVPRPAIDLSFFGPLAVAAGIYTSSQPAFNPFASFNAFLLGAFIFEDVGVTAYQGAAPLITAAGVASGYLTAAAGILAVEAYHAAYIRTALTAIDINAGTSTYTTIANQIASLRATLTVGNAGAPSTGTGNSGAAGSSSSVEVKLVVPTSTTTPSAIVAADSTNAIAFARNVNQVHHIVYGSTTVGVKSGGFFPNGTNSIFATTTA